MTTTILDSHIQQLTTGEHPSLPLKTSEELAAEMVNINRRNDEELTMALAEMPTSEDLAAEMEDMNQRESEELAKALA